MAGLTPGAVPVPDGFRGVYRAVGEAEYQDVVRTGRFRQGPNSMEGKWFAGSIEGAKAHGDMLYPDVGFRLVEADVPDDAPSLFVQPNLDGLGPARYLDITDLAGVIPRPLSRDRTDG